MIQINELIMSIPGISEEEGHSLGIDVVQKVADALPYYKGNFDLPELNIRLNESEIPNMGSLAKAISDQVILKIKQAMFA